VNLSLGVVMMFASSWPAEAMRVVILAALFGYLAILVAGLLYQRDPKWGPGLYVGYLLWIGQIGWGLWAVLRS